MSCRIVLVCEHPDPPPLERERLQRAVDLALAETEHAACSLTVLVIDDAAAADLHGQHFDDPTTTDVMTFPDGSVDPASGETLLGDLAICPDVARRVADERAGPDAPAERERIAGEECLLYVVHGVLHLLGYDDRHPDDRARMWQRQREILRAVEIEIGDD